MGHQGTHEKDHDQGTPITIPKRPRTPKKQVVLRSFATRKKEKAGAAGAFRPSWASAEGPADRRVKMESLAGRSSGGQEGREWMAKVAFLR